jgi:hypothetical protein
MKMQGITKRLSAAACGTLIAFFTLYVSQSALAQTKHYDEIEKTQDKIESLYMNVYGIMDLYPGTTYQYIYDGDEVSRITITGIPVEKDKIQLEGYLTELEKLKNGIFNLSNRVGVYYSTETEPKPKEGFNELYTSLQRNLTYPENAKENSVEGLVFVKFVVDEKGNIDNIVASEDIDTPFDWVIDDMKKEAKAAVKSTSGQWEPAEIGGIPVSKLVVLPVQFKLESPFFIPLY